MNKKDKPARTGKKRSNGMKKGGQSAADARKIAKRMERSFKIPIRWGKK